MTTTTHTLFNTKAVSSGAIAYASYVVQDGRGFLVLSDTMMDQAREYRLDELREDYRRRVRAGWVVDTPKKSVAATVAKWWRTPIVADAF